MPENVLAPRLIVSDAVGRRIVAIDKPLFGIGRRSEADLRLAGADISRQHAEITFANGVCTLRDCASRFGTFVNGEKIAERVLAHGDKVRFGQAGDTDIIFAVDDDAPSAEKSAVTAATELRHMAAMLEGLRALGSGRVLDEVLALVLDSAIDVTGAERGFIMLSNKSQQLEFKLARARGHITLPGKTFETSRKIPEQVFATGEQRIVEDLLDGDLAALHTGTVALGIRHVLCTPLRIVRYLERADEAREDNVAIGVLYLDSRERGALKSASARAALETLSAEAALAIENARLYREALDKAKIEQELKVAAGIQQSLLPASNRQGPFFTTAAASVACRSVGGDFFDYVDLPNGAFGFILGDVSGKGSPAALLAAAALGMFSAEATYQTHAAPLITRLNHGLQRRAVAGRFLTTFYGILASDGSFLYCNAGHNPPFLVGSEIRRLATGGMPLGMFELASFDEEGVRLQKGDYILAFSDGVSEAMNEAGDEFTDDRLLACIERHRQDGPQVVLDNLLQDVRTFCGDAPQSDDVTIVMVRFDG